MCRKDVSRQNRIRSLLRLPTASFQILGIMCVVFARSLFFLRLVMPQLYRALQEPNSQISYHLRQHGQFHSMNCQKKFTFMLIDLAERSADVDVGRAHLAGRRMRTRRQTRRHALIPSDVVLVPPVAVLPLAVSARHRRCAPVTLVIVVYN